MSPVLDPPERLARGIYFGIEDLSSFLFNDVAIGFSLGRSIISGK
jgi:hypothetical protein